eukprot:gene9870-biopygen9287
MLSRESRQKLIPSQTAFSWRRWKDRGQRGRPSPQALGSRLQRALVQGPLLDWFFFVRMCNQSSHNFKTSFGGQCWSTASPFPAFRKSTERDPYNRNEWDPGYDNVAAILGQTGQKRGTPSLGQGPWQPGALGLRLGRSAKNHLAGHEESKKTDRSYLARSHSDLPNAARILLFGSDSASDGASWCIVLFGDSLLVGGMACQPSKDWERVQRQCGSTARNNRGERQVPQRAGSGSTPTEDGVGCKQGGGGGRRRGARAGDQNPVAQIRRTPGHGRNHHRRERVKTREM